MEKYFRFVFKASACKPCVLRRVRIIYFCLFTLATLLFPQAVQTKELGVSVVERVAQFNIPQQQADKALIRFAEQASLTLVFPIEKTKGITSKKLIGKFTLEEAISLLLDGTGLSASFKGHSTIKITLVEESSVNKGKTLLSALVGFFTLAKQSQDIVVQNDEFLELEEVIVTAQRRSQDLQTVPISVNSVNAERLKESGVRDAQDISAVAPSVSFASGIGGGQVTIRGVGATGSGSDEPANAIYMDGVYIATPNAALFSFNNVDRVEILKGPQGTLFGRNASGGLIHVLTKQPSQTASFSGELGYGNFDTVSASLYGNAPLSDDVAVNIAVVSEEAGDGWGTNTRTGEDAFTEETFGVHSKLLWNMSDRTTFTLSGFYSEANPPNADGGGIRPGTTTSPGSFAPQEGFYDIDSEIDGSIESTSTILSTKVEHEFSAFILTSLTSYFDAEEDILADIDRSHIPLVAINIEAENKNFMQELRFSSASDAPAQWVAGLFYMDWDKDLTIFRTGIRFPAGANTQAESKTESLAVFAQATFPLSDRVDITTGLRHTRDKRDVLWRDFDNTAASGTFTGPEDIEESESTWRLALDYQINDDALIYGSYSRGFKSGLFELTSSGRPPIAPQTVDAYELGLKLEFANGRARMNSALFFKDIKDIQVRGVPEGEIAPIFFNGESVSILGVDLSLEAVITEALTIQANLAYLDSEYDEFNNAQFYEVSPNGGLTASVGDASGNNVALAAELSASLSAQYEVGPLRISATYSYLGDMYFDVQNRVARDPVNLLSATARWQLNDSLNVGVWGRNLAGEEYFSQIEPTNFADTYYPAAPRTYGVSLKFDFK